jgi:hypothetical protein
LRTKKVAWSVFDKMVRAQGPHSKFIRIPSTNEKSLFTGLVMADGCWVPWPFNLTDEEEKFYIEKYGDIPHLIEVLPEKVAIRQVIRDRSKIESASEDNTDSTS